MSMHQPTTFLQYYYEYTICTILSAHLYCNTVLTILSLSSLPLHKAPKHTTAGTSRSLSV